MDMTDLAQFWAKTDMQTGALHPMHPVLAHCLDVAAVAISLPESMLPLINHQPLDRRLLGFLASLHDIGKLGATFQFLRPDLWPAALGHTPAALPPGPRHDAAGLYLLGQLNTHPVLRTLFPDWLATEKLRILAGIAGHHDKPVSRAYQRPANLTSLEEKTLEAAQSFLTVMASLFQPPPFPEDMTEAAMDSLAWRLAEYLPVADWIGSNRTWFPYISPEDLTDPSAYFWNKALPQAQKAVLQAGLGSIRTTPFQTAKALLPHLEKHALSPLQHWAETVQLPDGPTLIVIEDMTGSGKTEAALILSHRLIARGQASGLFLALPTMATANAMFDRVAAAYGKMFHPLDRPSLALAHGKARLSERFTQTILSEKPSFSTPEHQKQPGESACSEWLASENRRALLAQVGVGTIDQALMAVLPVRYTTVRRQGLSNKILCCDEIHSFDPYMTEEMKELLTLHASRGGSVILLSATLSHALRTTLVNAFRKGLGLPGTTLHDTHYPLTTLVSTEAPPIETPCEPRPGLGRTVTINRLSDPDEAEERVINLASTGAAIAWIRNTVDDAIASAETLRARGVKVQLFHARFAMVDRLAIEQDILRKFGKQSSPEERTGVLVSSQILEQSLDVDFDALITDLAPADLLIQRAGRLWRHHRSNRPVAFPQLDIISPPPISDPDANWIRRVLPGTAAVYRDPSLLWRTARAFFSRSVLKTPEDVRPIIEEAADTTSPDSVPDALEKEMLTTQGKNIGAQGLGRQTVLKTGEPYDPGTGQWDTDLQARTRLETDPTVVVRLALLKNGTIHPYADDDDPARAWALSEIRVACTRLTSCPPPEGLQTAIETARACWPRWEREAVNDILVLVLFAAEEGGFEGVGCDKDDNALALRYHKVTGLMFAA
ncbi:CRISPR-associated protein Cas3 [Gluconobacter japonicus]|uniref:CRISPR-associated helicase/endonuclease Cas3 n=1 Tax=Gluconobacter japonicus TaxID=376620 RepID=A0A9Q2FJX7_GLUJA|nr:CRISPR-associated helicase/endonuclease Cas3 [Gluconobacter japonicus]KXV39858.1 CRISPR-associated protein Cas3 [Gluconobacter japonicus]MBF0869860.1 CRISPR-associated helicase/endonuclease Cas3 [Gluconobacter japonicus]